MIFKLFSQLSVDGPGKTVKISQFRQFCPLVYLIASMISMTKYEINIFQLIFEVLRTSEGKNALCLLLLINIWLNSVKRNLGNTSTSLVIHCVSASKNKKCERVNFTSSFASSTNKIMSVYASSGNTHD